jgi:hypothetical protein
MLEMLKKHRATRRALGMLRKIPVLISSSSTDGFYRIPDTAMDQ